MHLLIFTEGTIIMHSLAKGVSREERVKQSQAEGIQREDRNLAYDSGGKPEPVIPGTPYDFASYIPIDHAPKKLQAWKKQGATISYLTSRRIKNEIDTILKILNQYHFPSTSNLHYRQKGENYAEVAEKVMPDILIEDDCNSIGGEVDMTYPHLSQKAKSKIKSIPVPEFGGIDHLPTNLKNLSTY